ncbi:type VI secretion system baseplate subunit TssF [Pedobacter sp. MR2016-19]|uniref:type VI secretion system baseplate subunit TssF n=1 Tax=Pedobacter sp. MR2016-19 TaxID=2780089 RepID=UPI001874B4BE|nr:type VI secretion system baseplate subunit TssF [Pedobacter sp. MR2016-19]MBE5320479.1 type VI secretion system baseplate subunit TssF [Pedobacter sp. MR2016-19]
MKPVFYSSKDEIRNRILKNAEDFWNVKDSNDFDPLVRLIIEALSNELFNVANDVKNLENRIFDKISRILAPDHLTSSLPAHAIMHARPIEQQDYLSPYSQFAFKKNIPQENDKAKKTDIFFSPLHTVKVNNAAIKYIVTGNTLFNVEQLGKQPIHNTLPGTSVEKNTMYIGFSGIKDWMDFNKLNLFFDWKNYSVPENTYDLLSLGKWFYKNNELAAYTERFMDEPLTGKVQAPFHHKQLLNLIKADVLQFYSNRFITLGDLNDFNIDESGELPPAFSNLFQPAVLNQIDNSVKWLKVIFPAAINQEMLNELHIYINAFPVVNKRLSQIKHRLKTMKNIIPIKTESLDQMLAVENLKDNKGKSYNEIPYTNENEKGDGSFSIRYGGTERFDTRNAKELVDYLFELLRDEKAAFTAYGPDFLSTILKNLEQNIALIEQKSRSALKDIKELPSYIVLKPIDDADILFLDIWVTQAEEANHINAGSRLVVYDNNRVNAESIFLLSQTKGGRSRLNSTNRVQAYKYGLTTADRIITKADVINFCRYELGNKLKGITLAKGLIMDNKPNAGFIKTTDILIEPADQLNLSTQDWEELLSLTLAKLNLRSTMNIHYRLLLKPTMYRAV